MQEEIEKILQAAIRPEQWYTLSQVAKMYAVGERTVRAWIERGWLHVLKVGDDQRSTMRISRTELERFNKKWSENNGR